MYTNAHTHLELSALAELCPTGQEFGAWLQTMLAKRMQVDNATLERGIHSAIEQLHHNQTTKFRHVLPTCLKQAQKHSVLLMAAPLLCLKIVIASSSLKKRKADICQLFTLKTSFVKQPTLCLPLH